MNGRGRESSSKNQRLKGSKLLTTALLAIGILCGADCAKIADPQPPQALIPEAAVDLAAKQVSDYVVLTVSKPGRNTNGSPATNLRSLEVLRLAGISKTDALTGDGFARQASPILSIPAGKFSDYLHGDSFVIEDKLLIPRRSVIYSSSFRYAVVFTSNKNQAAGFSNQALIRPVPIPLPPTLTADVTESFIHLKWAAPSQNMDESKPARIAGYKIFRSEDSKIPLSPVNTDMIVEREFKDGNFQFDKTYYYRISVVGSIQNPYAESLPSDAIAVSAKDIFPPQPPGNFHAVFQDGAAYLLWVPSPSTDVAGYRIYRLEPGVAQMRLLKAELITMPSFQDSGLKTGVKYEYYVTAVDAHGNESAAVGATVQVP
jgi:hypothetical protein